MTVRYAFGSDPDALHQAMRLVLSWPEKALPADATCPESPLAPPTTPPTTPSRAKRKISDHE